MDDDAKAAIQESIDSYYAAFTKAVARGRGVNISAVRDGMGQGRCLQASEALAENMIDGIATFDQVVSKMQKSMRGGGSASAAVDAIEVSAESITNNAENEIPLFNHSAKRHALELLV